MTSSISLKAKQDDLRRLMKERRENLRDQKNKIESPFAKYNSAGQLFCTICNIQIKSNNHWVPHVAGKVHKENALKKQKGGTDIELSNTKTPEKKLEVQPPAAKKMKMGSNDSTVIKEVTKTEAIQISGKISLLDAYSSSSEDENEDEDKVMPSKPVSNLSPSNNVLPADFFDAAPSSTIETEQLEVEKMEPVQSSLNVAEALPEGFFDDPVLDAKARNIEYKDPIEEEWERYQKAIAEETNVSNSIIEEDLEESILEREISQIDEQIQQWERVKNLQTLADEVIAKVPQKDGTSNLSGSSDEELEEDDLLDWRTKSVKR